MKRIVVFITAAALLIVALNFESCTSDKFEELVVETNYPTRVEAIIVKKCATVGCHNTVSNQGAGGLDLSTWTKLFEGSRSGAVVIPYRSDFSTLCYYTNTDTAQGVVLIPTMPYDATPLSAAEYATLKNWIQDGAPDKNGFVKFSDYQNKSKLYVSNRGCDVVTVMDTESGLAMRYIDVGNNSDIEGPCMVKVSPDKLHWYVIFNQGTTIQKFRTTDNVKVGEINLGSGFWSSVVITSNSKNAFISDTDIKGRIVYIDLENMRLITAYQTGLRYPYGLCINNANSRLYATSKEGNYIYKLDINNPIIPVITEISLETGIPITTSTRLNPYSIILSNDETRYFVSCNKSSELRMMQASNDSLLATFLTGNSPAEMVISTAYPYLFISCLGVPGTNKKSAISIFDYSAETFLPEIIAGHDSKGIVIDEASNKFFVANRNVSDGGPAGHHAPICVGKNGYITAIDLNTLQMIPDFKVELSVDPYHIAK